MYLSPPNQIVTMAIHYQWSPLGTNLPSSRPTSSSCFSYYLLICRCTVWIKLREVLTCSLWRLITATWCHGHRFSQNHHSFGTPLPKTPGLWLGRTGGELQMNRLSLRDNQLKLEVCREITNHFRGIHRIYPISWRKTRGCQHVTRLDLQTLGS